MENFGVPFALQATEVKDKIKATNLIKFGFENPSQAQEIKDKKKETTFKNFGVENPSQSEIVKQSKINTTMINYGVTNPYQISYIRRKALETISDRFVLDTNEHLRSWFMKQTEPKPPYSYLKRCLKDSKITLDELSMHCLNWETHKTSLESFTEILLNVKHFNQRIGNLTKWYKPDFKLTDTVYVNVDGLYWHSEKWKDNNYHINMRQDFESYNLRLLQFHENEIYNKPLIVKSLVNKATNTITNKINIEQITIKPVSQEDATIFLNVNHLKGNIIASHIGLYDINDSEKLLSIMSYNINDDICIIERFCNLNDYDITDSFSSLLFHIEKEYLEASINCIQYLVDLRYGSGVSMPSRGFQVASEVQEWKWTDGADTFDANDSLLLENETIVEQLLEFGWYKIYDAGQRLFAKHI